MSSPARITGQLRWEVFNAFNLMNLGNPATTIGNANAGRITNIQGSPRSMQLSLKILF
jgi:hypothetical protein